MKVAFAAAVVAVSLLSETTAAAQHRIPLADIKSVDPTIIVELRYAGPNNIIGRPLYAHGTRAFVRPELLPRLKQAQKFLRQFNYRLKIWDAYRPPAVQRALWQASQNDSYVANPDLGAGSLHSWGVAVDYTLADLHNRDVQMPTDFDVFSPAALSQYAGANRAVRSRLNLLRVAMAAAGFYAFHNEWWHFTTKDWTKYVPQDEVARISKTSGTPIKSTETTGPVVEIITSKQHL